MKKTLLSVALGTALGLSANHSQALNIINNTVNLEFTGLLTITDSTGLAFPNVSKPYYYDATWGYGFRTQISGTLQFDTITGSGAGTINPFEFLDAGPATTSNFEFQAIGNGVGKPGSLMIANLDFSWNGNPTFQTQIVLDAAGLFTELADGVYGDGDVFDAITCASSGICATPASNNTRKGAYSIGPAPIATTSFNTAGATGYGTTLGQLSLGTDDGVGGSPMDSGPFSTFNLNYDFTSMTIVSAVPVPAAVWLFGSGLLGLAGFARRRRKP